ncbi:hypothetical protein GAY28_31760, partial [Azospirillum brasilense]|nr:hypothetical protein [Azospirillum brasilense]
MRWGRIKRGRLASAWKAPRQGGRCRLTRVPSRCAGRGGRCGGGGPGRGWPLPHGGPAPGPRRAGPLPRGLTQLGPEPW